MRYREFPMRKITILLAMIVAMAFTACDGQSVQIGDRNNNNSDFNNSDNNDDNSHTPEVPDEEEPGHGPDEGSESLAPGFLSGTWRVATAEEDTPIAFFDLVQVEGEDEVSGTYLMGVGFEGLADGNGEIIAASFDSGKLELQWNPTQADDEVFTVTDTVKVNDDLFTGVLTIKNDPEALQNVTITRQDFED